MARQTKLDAFNFLSPGHQKHIISKVIGALGTGTMSVSPDGREKRIALLQKAGVSTSFEPILPIVFTQFYKFSSIKRAPGAPFYEANPASGVVSVGFPKAVRERAKEYLENEKTVYPERSFHIIAYSIGRKREEGTNQISIPNGRFNETSERYTPLKMVSIVENSPFDANHSVKSDDKRTMEDIGLDAQTYLKFSKGGSDTKILASNLTAKELKKVVEHLGVHEFAETLRCAYNPPTGEALQELVDFDALKDYISYANQEMETTERRVVNAFNAVIKPERQLSSNVGRTGP